MFCFITSLRAAQASANWPRVCELFERTAASVFRQSNTDFRFVVVGHSRPILKCSFDQRMEFLTADLPVPTSDEEKWFDKKNKLIAGLRRARDINADYVMCLDSDDLVSSRLVDHVLSRPAADGWYVERGYKHSYGRRWLEPIDAGFNLVCGSCNILAGRWFAFPGKPDLERKAEQTWFGNEHGAFVRAFGAQGARIQAVPFRAVTYIVHDGDDRMSLLDARDRAVLSGKRSAPRRLAGRALLALRTVARRRPLINKLRDEFSIPGPLAS